MGLGCSVFVVNGGAWWVLQLWLLQRFVGIWRFTAKMKGWKGPPIMMKFNCQCWKTGVNMGIFAWFFLAKETQNYWKWTVLVQIVFPFQGMIFRFQPRVDYISKDSRDPSWFPIVFEVTNKLHFGSWAESLHQLFCVHCSSFHWTRLW